MRPTAIARRLSRSVDALTFAPPVTHVYNPLAYAWSATKAYLERYAHGRAPVLLLGMNPGPFGMVQTGVPFGEVAHVRDFLGIETRVRAPADAHPKRPIQGFACPRSEVSGRRLWAWARARFETADAFHEQFFVWNYCPLAFLEESGRNRTPDKLSPGERDALFAPCDEALRAIVATLGPAKVIGVGVFAQKRARLVLDDPSLHIGTVLHPSPASPLANRGWAERAEAQFEAQGIAIPSPTRS